MKKKKEWYLPLLNILVMVIIDIIAFVMAFIVEVNVEPIDELGHEGPGAIAVVFIVFGFLTIVVVLMSIILAVIHFINRNKIEQSIILRKNKKYWIALPIMVVIDILVMYGAMWIDQVNYVPPESGGFMIPIVFLLSILVMGTISFVVLIIVLILEIAQIRRNRRA